MIFLLLLPGFRLKNNDSENERSVSGSPRSGSSVSVRVSAKEVEGVLEHDDVEAQGLASLSNPHSATFLGVILGLQPSTSLRSSKYGKFMRSFPLLLL